MDPTQTLAQIREHLTHAIDSQDGTPETDTYHLHCAAHLTRSLDQWLSSGGFLPAEWTNLARPHGIKDLPPLNPDQVTDMDTWPKAGPKKQPATKPATKPTTKPRTTTKKTPS